MNDKDLNIVFLTPGFPKNEEDSTCIPALQIYLKTLRNIVPDATLTVLSFQYPFSNKIYHWNGIRVIPLNGRNKRFKKLFIWNKVFNQLNEINKIKRVTVLHSFWIGETSFIGQNFADKNKIRHIVTVMGQDAIRRNFYAKKLFKSNTQIICLSKSSHDLVLKNLKLKSQIIPWILDTESFPDLLNIEIDILGVGSLISLKNFPVFINIISILASRFPNLKVEIIGEGVHRSLLKKLINQKKLNNTIKLVGKLTREEVLQKMSQSNILLHTSLYESFGYVFAESLYAGMEVVSFNTGAARSIPSWKVCLDEIEMIKHLTNILSEMDKNRQRFLLNKKEDALIPYLKLYHG